MDPNNNNGGMPADPNAGQMPGAPADPTPAPAEPVSEPTPAPEAPVSEPTPSPEPESQPSGGYGAPDPAQGGPDQGGIPPAA